jgi:hypothetical protein
MEVRFLVDLETGVPHIERHGVSPSEALEVLRRPEFEGPGRADTRVAEGQTSGGRYLRVIYKRNEMDESLLVITAYDLTGKALRAFRRRRRRRGA